MHENKTGIRSSSLNRLNSLSVANEESFVMNGARSNGAGFRGVGRTVTMSRLCLLVEFHLALRSQAGLEGPLEAFGPRC